MAKAGKNTSVVYEVTLAVDRDIAVEFDAWLDGHVREMLAIEGFVDASIAHPDSSDKSRVLRVCSYELANQAALDHYFENDAERMRADGMAHFPGRFDASRRVYRLEDLPDNRKCLNCDAVLAARYCQICGQKNGPRVISLRELAGDLVDDLFDMDSRFWRSLKPLVFKPGFLTAEFVRGRRMYYSPPFRMYLVASIIFFLVVTFDPDFSLTANGDTPEATPGVVTSESNAEALEQIAAARAQIDPDQPGSALQEAALNAAERALTAEIEGSDVSNPEEGDDAGVDADTDTEDDDGLNVNDGTCNITGSVNLPFLTPERSRDVVIALCQKIVDDNGRAFGRALLNNLPAMMFLFLPVLALVLKFLYAFSKRYYVEHLVFSLHFHAFFFVVLTGTVLTHMLPEFVPMNGWIAGLTTAAVSIYIPVYLFKSMRRVYGQGVFFTLVKYLLLGIAYFLSLLATALVGVLFTLLAI